MNLVRRFAPILGLLALLALLPVGAQAHPERPAHFPPGTGQVPTVHFGGPRLIVCTKDLFDFQKRIARYQPGLKITNEALFGDCLSRGFTSLQDAVDHVVQPGTTISILPGVYTEDAYTGPPSGACANLKAPVSAAYGMQLLSYEQQKACPHNQNLVAILGLKNLQIEGTGASPLDVIIDGRFQKLNTVRADRADGAYFRNFTVQRASFNALYVLESDGFVIDGMVGRWNLEYGFLTFATDHGLYSNCEAYGNGDSGIYPGGTSDINKSRGYRVPRYAIEVSHCRSHNNLIGYSGTGGDSVHVHDSEFDSNTTGATMDSAFPNHPGLPQNHAFFEHNRIHGNNVDYYRYVRDGTCRKPLLLMGIEKGVVCPAVGPPIGTGVVVAGGNWNTFQANWIYDNWREGFRSFWVPAFIRSDYNLGDQFDTSNHDRFIGNHMGVAPNGRQLPNGLDFWWDGQGVGNCWDAGYFASDPVGLPGCNSPSASPLNYIPDPGKAVYGVNCSNYNLRSSAIPAGCDWFDRPVRPGTLAWRWSWLWPLSMLAGVLVAGATLRRRRAGSPPPRGRRPRRRTGGRPRRPAVRA